MFLMRPQRKSLHLHYTINLHNVQHKWADMATLPNLLIGNLAIQRRVVRPYNLQMNTYGRGRRLCLPVIFANPQSASQLVLDRALLGIRWL